MMRYARTRLTLGAVCLGLSCLLLTIHALRAQQVLPPVGPPTGIACAYNTSPPTVSTGNAIWVQCDTNGKLLTSGSTSLAGTTSNATSGVATSSTNIPTVSYNYGFNGTTWDQLQVDGSKNLKVVAVGTAAALTQSSVSVTNASTALLTAAQFTNFEKICVALTATTGVWVNWANAAAVTASPSEYIPPGQCDSWVKSTGFMPTAAAFAISNSASTIAVTVEGN